MKDRIHKIMNLEGLNQQEFSKLLQIAPASLSSIYNGRTQPTLRHAEAIHKAFPEISLNWLLCGEGDMYDKVPNSDGNELHNNDSEVTESAVYTSAIGHRAGANTPQFDFNSPNSGTISESTVSSAISSLQEKLPNEGVIRPQSQPMVREVVKYVDKPQRKVVEIRVFFDDGTFEVFSQGK